MKKTLLTICSAALLGFTSNAQDIEISLPGSPTDISGTVHMEATSTSDDVIVDFEVKNVGASSQDLIITRVNLNEPAGWSNYLCWGHSTDPFGICYPVSTDMTFTTPTAVAIGPSEYGKLKCYVKPETPSATAGLYRYYIGTTNVPKMDSVDIQVSSVLSLSPIKKDYKLSVSPNPASDFVKISVSNLESGNMKIVDVLGNVVAKSSFNGSKTLNVTDFKNGVYFIMISGEGLKTINRKLVVRH